MTRRQELCEHNHHKSDTFGPLHSENLQVLSLFIPDIESPNVVFKDSIYAEIRYMITATFLRGVTAYLKFTKTRVPINREQPLNPVSTWPNRDTGLNNNAANFCELKNLMRTFHSGMTRSTYGIYNQNVAHKNSANKALGNSRWHKVRRLYWQGTEITTSYSVQRPLNSMILAVWCVKMLKNARQARHVLNGEQTRHKT